MFLKHDYSHQPLWLLLKEALSTPLSAEYCCDLLSWPWQMQAWQRACFHGPSSSPHCCPAPALLCLISQHSHGRTFTSKAAPRYSACFIPLMAFSAPLLFHVPCLHLLKIPVSIKLLGFFVPSLRHFFAWWIQIGHCLSLISYCPTQFPSCTISFFQWELLSVLFYSTWHKGLWLLDIQPCK